VIANDIIQNFPFNKQIKIPGILENYTISIEAFSAMDWNNLIDKLKEENNDRALELIGFYLKVDTGNNLRRIKCMVVK